MVDICTAAGLSAGGLYRYFKTKDDIIVAFAEEERIENEPLIRVLQETNDPVAALTGITPHILVAFSDLDYGRLAVEALAEASRNSRVKQALARNEEELTQAIAHALARGQSAGQVRKTFAADQLATTVMMLYSGLASRGILDPAYTPRAYEQLVNELLDRLLRP